MRAKTDQAYAPRLLALLFNLRQYRAWLDGFEKQCQMTSDQFAARFSADELGDSAEWFEWEFGLDAYRETARQAELLKGVRL